LSLASLQECDVESEEQMMAILKRIATDAMGQTAEDAKDAGQ